MQRLAEDLSARERSIAERRHMKNAVAVKEKLKFQVKQVLAPMTEIEKEVMNGKETDADINAKLMVAGKRAENVV